MNDDVKVNPAAPAPEKVPEFNPQHAQSVLDLLDASSRIYTEIQGMGCHERLGNARSALHAAYINAEGAFEALKAEMEAIIEAAKPQSPEPTPIDGGPKQP